MSSVVGKLLFQGCGSGVALEKAGEVGSVVCNRQPDGRDGNDRRQQQAFRSRGLRGKGAKQTLTLGQVHPGLLSCC